MYVIGQRIKVTDRTPYESVRPGHLGTIINTNYRGRSRFLVKLDGYINLSFIESEITAIGNVLNRR